MTESPVRANEPLKRLNGISNDLELYADRLILRQTDMLSRLFGHEEVIALSDVKAIHVYPPQFITSGSLQLLLEGHEPKRVSVAFRKGDEQQAQAMQAHITELISSRAVVPILRDL